MSYSFSIRAATKTEAKDRVASELNAIAAVQPMHAADVDSAKFAATDFIDVIRDDAAQDVIVSVSGSVWAGAQGIDQVSYCVSAALSPKEIKS